MSLPPVLRCREITASDTSRIVDLLARGFAAERCRDYWEQALRTLAGHEPPPGFPKYGFVLEHDGSPVGVLLTIFSSFLLDGEVNVRCNVSSWFVLPDFRGYASLLSSQALKLKNVTYSNLTPASNTWAILKAQGYRPLSQGVFVAFPMLGPRRTGVRVHSVTCSSVPGNDLTQFDIDLLAAHARYGCVGLICEETGQRFPFVFRVGLKYGLVGRAHLVYCHDLAEFVRFAGPIGRYLARRGILMVDIDANGPIAGLIGSYRDGRPTFVKGPERVRLGDLAYSELAMFGL